MPQSFCYLSFCKYFHEIHLARFSFGQTVHRTIHSTWESQAILTLEDGQTIHINKETESLLEKIDGAESTWTLQC